MTSHLHRCWATAWLAAALLPIPVSAEQGGCPPGTEQIGTREEETADAIVVHPVCRRVASPRGADTAPLLRKPGESDQGAPGGRYVDCARAGRLYRQLPTGLGSQREVLARMQAQIDALQGERKALDQAQREFWLNTAYNSGKEIATNIDVLRGRVRALKTDGLTEEQRRVWLERLRSLDQLKRSIEKGQKSFEAGHRFGDDLPAVARDAVQLATGIHRTLEESGLYEEAGDMAARKLARYGGPEATLAIYAAKLTIAATILEAKRDLNDADLAAAHGTYDFLKQQLAGFEDAVRDAEDDLNRYCGGVSGAGAPFR